jgi:hypothetical protein
MGYILSATRTNYRLFLIVLGGVAAIAITSALIGCLTSRCFEVCQTKRKREQNDPEKALPAVTTSTVSSSASTVTQNGVDAHHDIVKRRPEGLVDQKFVFGRESHDYQKENRTHQGGAIVPPKAIHRIVENGKEIAFR